MRRFDVELSDCLSNRLSAPCNECLRSRGSPVFHPRLRVNLVAFQNDFSGGLFDPYADGLFARFGWARVADGVVSENQIPCFTAHTDAGGFAFDAVVFNQVIFQAIAVAGHALGFVAEEDSVLLVEPNLVVLQKIVRILVSNRDAEPSVVLQKVFLKQPVPDTPTQIQSILPIAPGDTFEDHRPLRTAALMEAQTGVVFAHAALNEDIVGLLQADAAAV